MRSPSGYFGEDRPVHRADVEFGSGPGYASLAHALGLTPPLLQAQHGIGERRGVAWRHQQAVEDEQFAILIECLVSLAARSPMHRERAVVLAEDFRGPLPERERNSLIGANIQRTLRNAVRNLGGGGKAMAIFSPEREFIFGDGFFHNLTIQGEHWHHPKILAPLTPWMSVLFTRPMSFRPEPRLVTMVASPAETDELNYAVQVYARNALFYRSERPQVDKAFTCGRHKIFANDRNSVDRLIHEIPGVPPRDPNMDAVIDLIERYGER